MVKKGILICIEYTEVGVADCKEYIYSLKITQIESIVLKV